MLLLMLRRRPCSNRLISPAACVAQRRAARWDRQTDGRTDGRTNARQSLETIQCTEIMHRIMRAGGGLSQLVGVYRTTRPSEGDGEDDDDGDGEADCCDDVGTLCQLTSSLWVGHGAVTRRHCITVHVAYTDQSALARLTPNCIVDRLNFQDL